MKTSAVSSLIRAHRALFVAATALLGVAASEVAARSGAARYWLLLAGSGLLMFVGDMFSSVEVRARILSTGSSVPISEARHDVFGQTKPKLTLTLAIIGVVVTAAGFTVPLPAGTPKAGVDKVSRLRCDAARRHGHLSGSFRCTITP